MGPSIKIRGLHADRSTLTPESRRFWEVLLSERRFLLGCLLASLLAATVYNNSFRPVYRAMAIVAVKETSTGAYQPPVDKDRVVELVNRQIVELTSLEFASTIVPLLDAAETAELRRGPLRSWLDKLRAEWNSRFKMSMPLTASEAVSVFRSRFTAIWTEASWIELRFQASGPVIAARILDRVLNRVIESNVLRNQEQAARASGELNQRLSEGKDKLGKQLDELHSEGQDSAIGDIEGRRQLLQQQARGFMEALVAAETTRAGRAATLRNASQRDGAQIGARSDPQLLVANGRVAELEDRERALLASLGDRHPEVTAVREQLALARQRVAGLIESFQKSAESQYQLAIEEEGRLRSQVQRIQGELAALDAGSVDYSLTKKKTEVAKASLDSIIQRGQMAADTMLEAKVVQPALQPQEPDEPKSARNYGAALGFGLLIGIVVVFLVDQMSDTVRLPDDFLKLPALRFLGSIPTVKDLQAKDLAAALGDAREGFGDSLRVIRTNLVFLPGAATRTKVIVISSASPQEGKSTAAVSLALAMKEIAPRVLLIDADLRRPSVHIAFGLPLRPGLAELVSASDSPEMTVRATTIPGLDLISAGHPQTLSSAIVGSDAMASLIEKARHSYDWVIIDAPPALALPDASVLSTRADGVVLVCASERSRLREIDTVVTQIQAVGGKILGAVLNRVDMSRHSYYYGRAYSSYYDSEGTAAKG